MKHITVLILASIFSMSAFADIITMECMPPRMLTGGASVNLAELTKGEKTSEGYDTYSGVLNIYIGGSTRKPTFDGPVQVKGVALADGALNLQGVNSAVSSVYMNQDAERYVEVGGKFYKTECRFY